LEFSAPARRRGYSSHAMRHSLRRPTPKLARSRLPAASAPCSKAANPLTLPLSVQCTGLASTGPLTLPEKGWMFQTFVTRSRTRRRDRAVRAARKGRTGRFSGAGPAGTAERSDGREWSGRSRRSKFGDRRSKARARLKRFSGAGPAGTAGRGDHRGRNGQNERVTQQPNHISIHTRPCRPETEKSRAGRRRCATKSTAG